VTKVEMAEKVYERVGFSRRECLEIVETALEVIKETLEQGEKVKISGFGNFVVRSKHERVGRNPQTGATMKITPRKVVTFKASRVLKDAVNHGSVK
jgi:integration host factor subunit alpha